MKLINKIVFVGFYYLSLIAFIYVVVIGKYIWEGFVNWIWDQLKKEYVKFGFVLYIGIDVLVNFVPIILYRRKDTKTERVPIRNDIALIIPCHKAQDVILKTLEHAIQVFQPKDIFVIDNGTSNDCTDNTKNICDDMQVNYAYIPVGSKTAAIYAGLKLTHQYKYVMQIDDDVYLDTDMSFPINDDTQIIAYTIGATTDEQKFIQYFQDIEYKTSGIAKAYKSYLGSDMFSHGAISLWDRKIFINVLENHPMYKISDDWFNGYVSNQMGYKLSVCDRTFIQTDVPKNYFFSSVDRTTGYGDVTLFSQRYSRWYRSKFLQLFYILYYIFFSWKQTFRVAIVQKLFFLIDILRIIFNIAKFLLIIPYFYLNWKLSIIMLSVYLVYSIVLLITFNFWNLQKEERLPLYVFLVVPLYKIYDGFVLFVSYMSSILIYTPIIVITKKEKLSENKKLNDTIHNYMGSYNTVLTPLNNIVTID